MTLAEFKDILLTVREPEWFDNINTTIEFIHTESKSSFKSVVEIFEFLVRQIEGWEKNRSQYPSNQFSVVCQPFISARTHLESFVTNNKALPANQLTNLWGIYKTNLNTIQNSFPFGCPEILFLIDLYK